jgi:hypothetical protein
MCPMQCVQYTEGECGGERVKERARTGAREREREREKIRDPIDCQSRTLFLRWDMRAKGKKKAVLLYHRCIVQKVIKYIYNTD